MDRPTRQPLTDLSRLSLTKEQLIRLREQRQNGLAPLLRAEQKRLRNYARQVRRRKNPDSEIVQRGVTRTINRYKLQKETWDAWVPPYAKLQATGGVSFDPETLDKDAMEIRREYNLVFSDGAHLRHGGTLDDGVRDWLISLYASLDPWVPRRNSGRKSRIGDSFFRPRSRRPSLMLTVTVANYYLPDLKLSQAMLDKLLQPRVDEEKASEARKKEYLRAAKQTILRPFDRRTSPRSKLKTAKHFD
jgi:hypothetical protein